MKTNDGEEMEDTKYFFRVAKEIIQQSLNIKDTHLNVQVLADTIRLFESARINKGD
jgi:hypothetical protein